MFRSSEFLNVSEEGPQLAPATNTLGLPLMRQALADVLFHVLADDDIKEEKESAEQKTVRSGKPQHSGQTLWFSFASILPSCNPTQMLSGSWRIFQHGSGFLLHFIHRAISYSSLAVSQNPMFCPVLENCFT